FRLGHEGLGHVTKHVIEARSGARLRLGAASGKLEKVSDQALDSMKAAPRSLQQISRQAVLGWREVVLGHVYRDADPRERAQYVMCDATRERLELPCFALEEGAMIALQLHEMARRCPRERDGTDCDCVVREVQRPTEGEPASPCVQHQLARPSGPL